MARKAGAPSGSSGGASSPEPEESRAKQEAERTKKAAVAAAKAVSDDINADAEVDKRTKDRTKEFVDNTRRAASVSRPTDYTLETTDQAGQVGEMAKAAGAGASGSGGSQTTKTDSGSQAKKKADPRADLARIENNLEGLSNRGARGERSAKQKAKASETPPAVRNLTAGVDGGRARSPTRDTQSSSSQRGSHARTRRGPPGVANKAAAVGTQLRDDAFGVYATYGAGTDQKHEAVRVLETDERRGQYYDPNRARYAADRNPDSKQAQAVDALATQVANQRFEDFKQPRRRRPGGRGGLVVAGPEAGQRVTVGRTTRPQQTGRAEEFGDFDWSFGLGGPEDEVEQALGYAASSYDEFATAVGDATAATSAQRTAMSPAVMFTQALGGDVGTVAEEPVDPDDYDSNEAFLEAVREQNRRVASKTGGSRYLSSSVTGAAMLGNLPGIAHTGLEATEYVSEGSTETSEGNFWEFAGKSGERGAAVTTSAIDYAWNNKARTAGTVTGALVGSYGAMNLAGQIGPRAGAASRLAIQPGEEALGYAGYYATQAARGTRAAERWFPNKEPLIFSEEAAIRAADAGASKLSRAVNADSLDAFMRAERGQTRLTGRTKRRTETPESDDDLGVPDDDPWRVSDKRLYDPAREFGDADDPSRFIDETRTGSPLYEQDIGGGIAGKGDPQTATGEYESFEENFNARIEAAQKAEAGVRPRLELALGAPQSVAERQQYRQAYREALATGQIELARELERSLVASEVLVGSELGIGTETELDSESGNEWELNRRSQGLLESETETETDLETEAELEVESEARGGDRDQRPWEVDFSLASGSGSSGIGQDFAAGWFNEFVTAYALGAGPRQAAAGGGGGSVSLSEQRATKAQAAGSPEIDAAVAAFTFEGLGLDVGTKKGGESAWFDF